MESPSPLRDVILGFMSNPLEIILVVAGLLTLLIVVLGIYIYGNRKRLTSKMKQSRSIYESRIRELGLTKEERDLLQKMYPYLSDPEIKKHLLLSNQSLFNLCASRLMQDQDIDEGTLSSLRVRLGFKRRSIEKQIISTTLLPAHIFLLIVQRETKRFYGKLISSDREGLVIRINDRQIVAPGVGSRLTCYFKTKSGTFHFTAEVLSLQDRDFKISHSERISRSQRRKYYRTKIPMAAFVRLAGSEEPMTPTRFMDISGGGAALINPQRRFRTGEDVQIDFETPATPQSASVDRNSVVVTPGGTEYSIVAEIVRLSRDGDVMHLVFGPLNESTRDRIVSFVLNLRRKKMH